MNINVNSGKIGLGPQDLSANRSARPQQSLPGKTVGDSYSPGKGALNYQRVQQAFEEFETPNADKVAEAEQILKNWETPGDNEIDAIFGDLFS